MEFKYVWLQNFGHVSGDRKQNDRDNEIGRHGSDRNIYLSCDGDAGDKPTVDAVYSTSLHGELVLNIWHICSVSCP
jgi:hypothetical protein